MRGGRAHHFDEWAFQLALRVLGVLRREGAEADLAGAHEVRDARVGGLRMRGRAEHDGEQCREEAKSHGFPPMGAGVEPTG